VSINLSSVPKFEIWLETKPQLAATKMSFTYPPYQLQRTLIRGRGVGAFPSPYSFPWSSAPKALVALAIKTAIQHIDSGLNPSEAVAILEGRKGSLAASLDYAISKKPNWVMELFSSDKSGRSLVQKFLLRTNPERKLGESVLVCFNQKILEPRNVCIYVNGKIESSRDQLQSFLNQLAPETQEDNTAQHLASGWTSTAADRIRILETVRKERYGYFAPGPDGWDAATLALYENPGLVKAHSYFYRPALSFCPRRMLEKMRVHDSVLARNKHVLDLLQSGKYLSIEMFPERALLDIIRLRTESAFKFYPDFIETADIIDYLDHLISILDNCPNYQMILTAANIPLQVCAYDFKRDGKFERFSSHINRVHKDFSLDYECVLVHQEEEGEDNLPPPSLLQWISSNIMIDDDRASVRDKILNVKAIIVNEGPLPPYEE
jgi:hypothetical protein